MRRLIYFFVVVLVFAGCQRVEKIKSSFQKDLKKADSVVSMAVDSISAQVISDSTAGAQGKVQASPVSSEQERENLNNAYSVLLNAIKTKDLFLLRQLSYYNDSLFFITVQGIFQVLSLEPVQTIYDNLMGDLNDSAWSCALEFSHFPDMNNTQGNLPAGCFARHIDEFHKFSAVIDLEREANLPVDPLVAQKAKDIESRISYEVLNTYLGWSFYFIKENGKFYLVAIDFNQY